MKYVALAHLPHGQKPGDVFEESEAIGAVFLLAKIARVAEPEDLRATPRRRYQRRDLEAAAS